MTNAVDIAQSGTISSSWRNRIINGDFIVAQRTASATVTAGTAVPTASTGYPCVDRWFVYSTGANVTAAQVAGSGSVQNRLQITGAASVTAVGVGQRIETNNSYDLNGKICTLSVDLANSVLTTVTWTASYANTSNTFGTIGTPTKTQIATGTFTVSSTVTNYTTQITVPSAAVTGIEILFTVGAQTSGTWTIGNVQFEAGSAASPFEYLAYSTELALCQRYFQLAGQGFTGCAEGTTAITINEKYMVVMRAAPSAAIVSGQSCNIRIAAGDTNNASPTLIAPSTNTTAIWTLVGGFSGLTSGLSIQARNNSTSTLFISLSAEL